MRHPDIETRYRAAVALTIAAALRAGNARAARLAGPFTRLIGVKGGGFRGFRPRAFRGMLYAKTRAGTG